MWKVLLRTEKEKVHNENSSTRRRDAGLANRNVLPEGSECLEVNGLKDVFRSIKFQQQHDENAVVGQLLEFCLTNIMVLD